MPMKETHLISICGKMEQDGEGDKVELLTRGSFHLRENNFFILYKESEATGYGGCTTTVKLSTDARKVTMTRFGDKPSQLVIEKGVRHLCHYETGFGNMTLGVAADEISHHLTEQGGTLRFSYTLDLDHAGALSHNLVEIKVSPIAHNPLT